MSPTTLTQVVGLFNIMVGLMLTLSILLMGTGIVVWLVRLGTAPTYRDESIKIMQWAIAMLFSLILLLLFSQFIQQHTAMAVYLLGFVIIGVIGWLIYIASQTKSEEHAEE